MSLIEKIEPIQGHVVVRRLGADEKLDSGLYNPSINAGSRMRTGEVLNFDKNIDDKRMKEGAKVVYLPDAGNEITINGETRLYLGYLEVKGYRIEED